MLKPNLLREFAILLLLSSTAHARSAFIDMDYPALQHAQAGKAESIQAVDLVKLVRQSFYEGRYIAAQGEPDRIWTPRMQDLFRRDRKISAKRGIGNLNFDFPSSSQDPHISRLKIDLLSVISNKAVVRAKFKNWKDQMEIRYTFLMQGGKYLLDEVQSFGKNNEWILSNELSTD